MTDKDKDKVIIELTRTELSDLIMALNNHIRGVNEDMLDNPMVPHNYPMWESAMALYLKFYKLEIDKGWDE